VFYSKKVILFLAVFSLVGVAITSTAWVTSQQLDIKDVTYNINQSNFEGESLKELNSIVRKSKIKDRIYENSINSNENILVFSFFLFLINLIILLIAIKRTK
jgi:hypothetical protein